MFPSFKSSITPFHGFIWQEFRYRDHVSFWLGTEMMTNALIVTGWGTSCKYKQENYLKNQMCVAVCELLVREQSSASNWPKGLQQASLPSWEEISSQPALERQSSSPFYL